MILGHLALVAAALFASAAFYVNFAEQPARLALDDRAALLQWQRSYERAALMQASLAMVGFFLGLAAWWWQGRDATWLVGALAMLAPWPWTLLVIKPVNDRLKADDAGARRRGEPGPDRALGPAACRPDGARRAGDGDLLLGDDRAGQPDAGATQLQTNTSRQDCATDGGACGHLA